MVPVKHYYSRLPVENLENLKKSADIYVSKADL
jgi:hypothetical protein